MQDDCGAALTGPCVTAYTSPQLEQSRLLLHTEFMFQMESGPMLGLGRPTLIECNDYLLEEKEQ